jgi:predicted phosphohydrolase
MAIYAISDLHLSFGENKPMNIFGENWTNHEEKIKKDWQEKVKENDIILMPGDFSWAMYLEDTYKDFEYLNSLPGKKILLKGNHDYWWSTLTKMRKFLEDNNFKNIDFIQNNFYEFDNVLITGTHGWVIDDQEDNKTFLYAFFNSISTNRIDQALTKIQNKLLNDHVYNENGGVVRYPERYKDLMEV